MDIVVDTCLTGEPDMVPPLIPLQVDGLLRPPYRAFPLPDHCADKLCAIIETHEQVGAVRASSRVKDLVDLALIARTQHVDGSALRTAILSGTAHRRLPLPGSFSVPDLPSWNVGFAKIIAAAPGEPIAFADAVDLVGCFLNPILAGPITATWDPHSFQLGNAGGELFMSMATVKQHVSLIFTKLDLNDRTQIALLAHDADLTGTA